MNLLLKKLIYSFFIGYTHTAGSQPQTSSVNQNAQSPEPEAGLKTDPSSTAMPGHQGPQPGPGSSLAQGCRAPPHELQEELPQNLGTGLYSSCLLKAVSQ